MVDETKKPNDLIVFFCVAPPAGYAGMNGGYGMQQQPAMPNYGMMGQAANGGMPNYGAGAMPNYGAGAMPNYGAGASPNYGAGASPNYGAGASPNYAGMPYGAGMGSPGELCGAVCAPDVARV